MDSWCLAQKLKRLHKFAFSWGIAVVTIYTFDYVFMVWLAMKFSYFMVFPLYVALFLACLGGLYIYDFLDEDVFFIEKINGWLKSEGKFNLTRKLKSFINRNPKNMFMMISVWESPLHGYLYFRKEEDSFSFVLKRLAWGSVYCAIFWGVLVDILIFIWSILKPCLPIAWKYILIFLASGGINFYQ